MSKNDYTNAKDIIPAFFANHTIGNVSQLTGHSLNGLYDALGWVATAGDGDENKKKKNLIAWIRTHLPQLGTDGVVWGPSALITEAAKLRRQASAAAISAAPVSASTSSSAFVAPTSSSVFVAPTSAPVPTAAALVSAAPVPTAAALVSAAPLVPQASDPIHHAYTTTMNATLPAAAAITTTAAADQAPGDQSPAQPSRLSAFVKLNFADTTNPIISVDTPPAATPSSTKFKQKKSSLSTKQQPKDKSSSSKTKQQQKKAGENELTPFLIHILQSASLAYSAGDFVAAAKAFQVCSQISSLAAEMVEFWGSTAEPETQKGGKDKGGMGSKGKSAATSGSQQQQKVETEPEFELEGHGLFLDDDDHYIVD